jgi:hypothetical protein
MPDRRAPDRAKVETPRATLVAARAGIGLGLGTQGIAAHELLQAEVFPLPFLGLGVEGERAGSTEVGLFEPTDHDEVGAVRGRLVLRFARKNATLVGALAIGRAEVTTVNEFYVPEPECESFLCPAIDHSTRGDVTPSVVLELGGRYQWSVLEFGGHVRIDVSPPAVIITAGPTLGLGF